MITRKSNKSSRTILENSSEFDYDIKEMTKHDTDSDNAFMDDSEYSVHRKKKTKEALIKHRLKFEGKNLRSSARLNKKRKTSIDTKFKKKNVKCKNNDKFKLVSSGSYDEDVIETCESVEPSSGNTDFIKKKKYTRKSYGSVKRETKKLYSKRNKSLRDMTDSLTSSRKKDAGKVSDEVGYSLRGRAVNRVLNISEGSFVTSEDDAFPFNSSDESFCEAGEIYNIDENRGEKRFKLRSGNLYLRDKKYEKSYDEISTCANFNNLKTNDVNILEIGDNQKSKYPLRSRTSSSGNLCDNLSNQLSLPKLRYCYGDATYKESSTFMQQSSVASIFAEEKMADVPISKGESDVQSYSLRNRAIRIGPTDTFQLINTNQLYKEEVEFCDRITNLSESLINIPTESAYNLDEKPFTNSEKGLIPRKNLHVIGVSFNAAADNKNILNCSDRELLAYNSTNEFEDGQSALHKSVNQINLSSNSPPQLPTTDNNLAVTSKYKLRSFNGVDATEDSKENMKGKNKSKGLVKNNLQPALSEIYEHCESTLKGVKSNKLEPAFSGICENSKNLLRDLNYNQLESTSLNECDNFVTSSHKSDTPSVNPKNSEALPPLANLCRTRNMSKLLENTISKKIPTLNAFTGNGESLVKINVGNCPALRSTITNKEPSYSNPCPALAPTNYSCINDLPPLRSCLGDAREDSGSNFCVNLHKNNKKLQSTPKMSRHNIKRKSSLNKKLTKRVRYIEDDPSTDSSVNIVSIPDERTSAEICINSNHPLGEINIPLTRTKSKIIIESPTKDSCDPKENSLIDLKQSDEHEQNYSSPKLTTDSNFIYEENLIDCKSDITGNIFLESGKEQILDEGDLKQKFDSIKNEKNISNNEPLDNLKKGLESFDTMEMNKNLSKLTHLEKENGGIKQTNEFDINSFNPNKQETSEIESKNDPQSFISCVDSETEVSLVKTFINTETANASSHCDDINKLNFSLNMVSNTLEDKDLIFPKVQSMSSNNLTLVTKEVTDSDNANSRRYSKRIKENNIKIMVTYEKRKKPSKKSIKNLSHNKKTESNVKRKSHGVTSSGKKKSSRKNTNASVHQIISSETVIPLSVVEIFKDDNTFITSDSVKNLKTNRKRLGSTDDLVSTKDETKENNNCFNDDSKDAVFSENETTNSVIKSNESLHNESIGDCNSDDETLKTELEDNTINELYQIDSATEATRNSSKYTKNQIVVDCICRRFSRKSTILECGFCRTWQHKKCVKEYEPLYYVCQQCKSQQRENYHPNVEVLRALRGDSSWIPPAKSFIDLDKKSILSIQIADEMKGHIFDLLLDGNWNRKELNEYLKRAHDIVKQLTQMNDTE